MASRESPPWKRKKPASSGKTRLTAANIAWAKARARKAGRRYPNLVDNMAAAQRQRRQAEPKSRDRDRVR